MLLALACVAGLVRLYQYWRANRYRREALQELSGLLTRWQASKDDLAYLTQLQALLKRTAITRFPREEVAAKTGEAWLAFMNRSTGSRDYSVGKAEAFIESAYKPDAGTDINVTQIHRLAESWIRRHHPRHLAARAGGRR